MNINFLTRQTLYKFLTQKGDELMLEVKNLTFQEQIELLKSRSIIVKNV